MKKVFFAIFVLYVLCLLPGLGWGDVGKYQLMSTKGGFPLNAGLHPWYYLLSNFFNRIIPFGSVAYKANLLSSVLAICSLVLFARYCRRLEISKPSIVFGVLSLALSHTFWCTAEWAESYSLFCVIWICAIGNLLVYFKNLASKDLCWGLFFLGLGMGNNLIQPFAVPAILIVCFVFLKECRNIKFWVKPVLFGFLGMSPWLLRILYAWQVQDYSNTRLELEVMDSKYSQYLFWNQSIMSVIKGLVVMLGLCLYQFHVMTLPLIKNFKQQKLQKWFLVILIFTMMLFCSTYLRQRAAWLMISAYIPLAFLITLSFEHLEFGKLKKYLKYTYALSPLLYFAVPVLLHDQIVKYEPINAMAGRDVTKVFLRPWKFDENSAPEYLDEISKYLKSGDVLYVDFTPMIVIANSINFEGRFKNVNVKNIGNFDPILNPDVNYYFGRFNQPYIEAIENNKDKIKAVKTGKYLWKIVLINNSRKYP